ncbi:MAG: cation:proton antiporter [Pseudomonadota bacterium]
MATILGSAAFVAVCIVSLSATKLGARAASAPGMLLIAGAAVSLFYRALGLPFASIDLVAGAAEAGLAALAFVSATQFRVSRLSGQCPTAFRLTLGGAPLFLFACSLAAFILLPQLNLASALLLGAALMLNGAAFDRRAVINTPAPADIKTAVRLESAAIIALGAPVAILLGATATAAATNEPAVGPLLQTSLAVFKGFALGGGAGLAIGVIGNRLARGAKKRAHAYGARLLMLSAIILFCAAKPLGADPVIAALAAGLLWGEETKALQTTRLRMRRMVEQGVTPVAYLIFGALFAPRILQADMLSIVFALAAVTVMRAGPRLAILQTPSLPKESQVFLAWFGGAPGAASALFIMMLLGNPAITNQEGVLTVGALAVFAGVLAARLTSKPLANAYLRERALASKRRMFAG